jgi:hypothetical protein
VRADAVFGFVVGEVGADIFDEVAVQAVEVVLVIRYGFFFGGEGVVGDVLVLLKEASVEFEKLTGGAVVGWCDAVVGDLFAHDGLALAGGHAGVLDVDVAGALGFGVVLVQGYADHDVGGGGLLGECGYGWDDQG